MKKIFLFFLIVSSVSIAAAQVPGWPTIDSKAADENTREIFEARQAQWLDELTGSADILTQCKYASAIPTLAPSMKVALTFDDGPDPANNAFVLDVLRRHGVPATFFFVGNAAAAHPGLVAATKAAGHLIASHSWDHSNFHKLTPARQAKQITDAERPLKPYMPWLLFRYPYGNSSCPTNKFLKGRGYKFAGWHVDSCDWGFNKTGSVSAAVGRGCGVTARNMNDYAGHVVDTVRAEGGGILLLHEVQPNTLRKLEDIIVTLKRDGFQFVNLDAPEMRGSLW